MEIIRLNEFPIAVDTKKPRRIGFLMEEVHALAPVGQIIDRLVSFRVGQALTNGNIPIHPTEGPLKGKTCILPANTVILFDTGLA